MGNKILKFIKRERINKVIFILTVIISLSVCDKVVADVKAQYDKLLNYTTNITPRICNTGISVYAYSPSYFEARANIYGSIVNFSLLPLKNVVISYKVKDSKNNILHHGSMTIPKVSQYSYIPFIIWCCFSAPEEEVDKSNDWEVDIHIKKYTFDKKQLNRILSTRPDSYVEERKLFLNELENKIYFLEN
jgi:hypothetical protein